MLKIVDITAHLPIRITRWHVVFWKTVFRPSWLHRLAPGPYKHISALGYSARCNVWVFYYPAGNGDRIEVVANDETFLALVDYLKERADLLEVDVTRRHHPLWRPGFYCVPQIIRLLGVQSSALTPRGLFNDLLRSGARQSSL